MIASAIGMTLVLALTKTSTGQLKFYNAIQSVFDEQDLSYAMGKVLTNDVSCKANLKPSRLNNGDMTVLVQGLNDPDVQDMNLIEKGKKFKSLSIVKINLSGSGDPETQVVSRELTVYFNRKAIKTRDNNPCSSTDTSGCYSTKCLLKYRVTSSDVTLCDVQTCAGRSGANLSGIKCNGGYLVGFDNQGQKICNNLSDLWSCPQGQSIRGFDTNNQVICRSDELCADGEYLKGFDNNGNKVCEIMPQPQQPQQPRQPPAETDSCGGRGYSAACNMCKHSCQGLDYWHDSVCGCKASPFQPNRPANQAPSGGSCSAGNGFSTKCSKCIPSCSGIKPNWSERYCRCVP